MSRKYSTVGQYQVQNEEKIKKKKIKAGSLSPKRNF